MKITNPIVAGVLAVLFLLAVIPTLIICSIFPALKSVPPFKGMINGTARFFV